MKKLQTIENEKLEKFSSILIFGPPGSGKGTLGKFLSSAGNHFHLSSGDIFRGMAPESAQGKLYHSYADKGLLVPDETTVTLWFHFVKGLIATNRYFPQKQLLLLDGIPRTVKQAKLMDRYIHVQKIIQLELHSEEELLKRTQRRGVVENRADDQNPTILQKRMEVYHEETKPVLEHYPKDLIFRCDALLKPLEVLRDVLMGICDTLT